MAFAKLGDFKTAKTHFEQLQQLTPEDGIVYRDWAIYFALKGDKTSALSNLEKAVELGYSSLERISKEDAFESLRIEPRYQAVIEKLKTKTNNQ